jgi:DsbC/DsbD-like thiol-disulfide interchange protein
MHDWGLAEMMRLSGQEVRSPWVIMPPSEWPETPTPMSVRMRPASGPLALRARVLVRICETSWEVLPVLTSSKLWLKCGAGTMKPASASRRMMKREFWGLLPKPWVKL